MPLLLSVTTAEVEACVAGGRGGRASPQLRRWQLRSGRAADRHARALALPCRFVPLAARACSSVATALILGLSCALGAAPQVCAEITDSEGTTQN